MKNILALLVALISFATFSQSLAPFLENGKWGYINPKGEIVIEPRYRDAHPFSEDGLAVVLSMSKQWSYINSKNEPLTVNYKAFIASKKGFNNGLAMVVVKKKKGIINTKGEEVYAPEYDFISVFSNGFATAKKGTTYFVLDSKGNAKEIPEKVLKINRFTNGLAPFKGSNELFGFINTNGEIAIEAKYQGAGHFDGELAWVRGISRKIGFINAKGEMVIQPKYLAAKGMDAKTGLSRAKDESGWLFVSISGKEVRVDGAIAYGDFSDGIAWARKANKKIGFINTKGEWIIDASFLAVRKFSNGFCAVKEGDKWGFINSKGEWAVKPTYVKVKDFILIQ